jgi:cytoskeletal protein RodZ
MAAVGAYLRELRVKRGLSLEELARITRVAGRYLDALENDAFNALPEPVFTRGFIRAYCQAVGASPEEALARYDGREVREAQAPTLATPRTASVPPPQTSSEGEPRTRSAILVSFVLLVVLGVALFAVALMTQPAREQRVERTPPPAPAPPPAPPVAAITPAPEVATRPIPAPAVKPPPPRPPEQTRPRRRRRSPATLAQHPQRRCRPLPRRRRQGHGRGCPRSRARRPVSRRRTGWWRA